jgi:hypothetical protein
MSLNTIEETVQSTIVMKNVSQMRGRFGFIGRFIALSILQIHKIRGILATSYILRVGKAESTPLHARSHQRKHSWINSGGSTTPYLAWLSMRMEWTISSSSSSCRCICFAIALHLPTGLAKPHSTPTQNLSFEGS